LFTRGLELPPRPGANSAGNVTACAWGGSRPRTLGEAMKPLRILIADDHEMVRRGLQSVLATQPGWEVCGEAITGRDAVELAERLRPDILILDIAMPELNGLEVARRLHRSLSRCQILILTMHESEELVRDVLAAGARGYV